MRGALAVLLALAAPAAAAPVPEPQGYRAAPYLAPVPETLAGATVIDGAEAIRLHAAGVPFLDVYPRTKRPETLPAGTLFREPRHDSIPGATWLPGIGFEALNPAEQALMEAGLRAATGGDKTRPVVIFCRMDCWLSWNAAKRAVSMGYTGVYWLPDGTEGWQAAGGADLVPLTPPED